MGFFDDREETCCLCGNKMKVSVMNSGWSKLADGKYICNSCVKACGMNAFTLLQLTSEEIRQRIASKALVEQKEFNPSKKINRVALGLPQKASILELDEQAGLINLPILTQGVFTSSQVDYIKPVEEIINF